MLEDNPYQNRIIEDIFLHYKIFDEIEQLAVRLSLFFCYYVRKTTPDYNGTKFSLKVNPTKNILFKYCFKMIQEIKNKLISEQYELFIRSQVDVIKNMHKHYGNEFFIDPSVLVGEKAWKRWCVWKIHYDKQLGVKSVKDAGVDIDSYKKITDNLTETKKTLERKLGRLNLKMLQQAADNGTLYRWFYSGVICGHFMKLLKINHNPKYNLDLSLYSGINDEVEVFFNTEFNL